MTPTNIQGELLINFYNPPSTIPILLHGSHYIADPNIFPLPLNHDCPQCRSHYKSFHTHITHGNPVTSQLPSSIHATSAQTTISQAEASLAWRSKGPHGHYHWQMDLSCYAQPLGVVVVGSLLVELSGRIKTCSGHPSCRASRGQNHGIRRGYRDLGEVK